MGVPNASEEGTLLLCRVVEVLPGVRKRCNGAEQFHNVCDMLLQGIFVKDADPNDVRPPWLQGRS